MQVGRKKKPPQSAELILHQLSQVVHNPERDRFELWVAGDLVGVLGYHDETVDGSRVLTILHTVLFDEYTGHGLASRLMRDTLQYVSDQGAKVRPVCTFTKRYLAENPGFAALAV